MNILLTNVALPQDYEYSEMVSAWRRRRHVVETIPYTRLIDYLRWDPASGLAAVDLIVCYAQMPPGLGGYTALSRVSQLAYAVEDLPEYCAMRDGRKWRSVPLIAISEPHSYPGPDGAARHPRVTIITPNPRYPDVVLARIKNIFDGYISRVLDDYQSLGMLVRFQRGHAQIGPALRKKRSKTESEFYFAPADRRRNRRWLTVMRDVQGLRADVELFQELLDRNASETDMQHFLEEHPAFLMEARLGIPISHPSYAIPKRWSPDFALTPILGPIDGANSIELLELKGPSERLLNRRSLHQGFSRKVHEAIDQVRDYDRFMNDPANLRRMQHHFGYLPTTSTLAVLIGRDPNGNAARGTYTQRQLEVDVKVITYDEILETQAGQLGSNEPEEITSFGSGFSAPSSNFNFLEWLDSH